AETRLHFVEIGFRLPFTDPGANEDVGPTNRRWADPNHYLVESRVEVSYSSDLGLIDGIQEKTGCVRARLPLLETGEVGGRKPVGPGSPDEPLQFDHERRLATFLERRAMPTELPALATAWLTQNNN